MRKVMFVLIAIVLAGCPTDLTNTGNPQVPPVEPIEPVEPVKPIVVDPAFWFGEVYSELIVRIGEIDSDSYSGPTGDEMGQIANCQYVVNAINAKWGAGRVSLASGTATQVANCEYLLKMIDKANKGKTTFGTSNYATTQVVDVIAVNDAVNRLWRPDGKFVAVGGELSVAGSMTYSTDGISWVTPIITATDNRWQGVTYGNGKYVAVNNSSINNSRIAYSTDGINWTRAPNTNYLYFGVTYGNGKYVVGGESGFIAYSTDGINWTSIQVGSQDWKGVTYGGD